MAVLVAERLLDVVPLFGGDGLVGRRAVGAQEEVEDDPGQAHRAVDVEDAGPTGAAGRYPARDGHRQDGAERTSWKNWCQGVICEQLPEEILIIKR